LSDVDDLLEPVLGERPPAQRPWRLGSQIYVAILGGALAVGAVAVLNARRLRLSVREQLAIAAAALVAEALLIVVAQAADLGGQARLVSALAGAATYGVAWLVQRSADRVFAFHAKGDDDPYASLLPVGAAAVIAARLIEIVLIYDAT
jgi:hypothetical protein